MKTTIHDRVILLNPPGDEVYIRDYYCSKVSKTDYIYHPIDLLYISGMLGAEFELEVIDAIAEELNEQQCLTRIRTMGSKAIIFLTGAVSWREDRLFLERLKAQTDVILLGSGDVFMDGAKELLEQNPFLDGVILDFFDDSVRRFLLGEREGLTNVMYRAENGQIRGNIQRKNGLFEVPLPCYHYFPNRKYKYPFAHHRRFATVLTDYGCPYHCHFCIMNTLGFRQRSVDNVIDELVMYHQAGIREIYFADQTFGANKKRLHEICNRMITQDLKMDWLCFSRVDLIDQKTVTLLKQAGCHTILFGVESAHQQILDRYRKGITLEQVRTAFHLCRQAKIATVGTFIIGLPGETEETCLKTIKLACELKCDYASFNVPVPRVGTTFREEAIAEGWTDSKLEPMCQAYTYPVMGTDQLPREKIWKLRNQAIIEFYLRPSYIIQRLRGIHNFYQLETHVRGIYFMIRGMFK
ncbi:radical SAM protein [bacterium]|nr:radical SAM protein [bacterium]